jgi:hypothetical protein
MRKIIRLFPLSFLVGTYLAVRAESTNEITFEMARSVVKHLKIGMQQSEVRTILETNGFKKAGGGYSLHSNFIQQDSLANGFSLRLEYVPVSTRSNHPKTFITTSRLQSASLISNGLHFSSITLSNAP